MFLGLKFFIALFLVMFVGLAALTYTNVTSEANDLLEQVELAALRTTDLIKESTHYSMLINRKEDIHQIFKNFTQMPGFEVIRIYDKEGEIIFTTRSEERLNKVGIASEACQVCHRQAEPLKALASEERHRLCSRRPPDPNSRARRKETWECDVRDRGWACRSDKRWPWPYPGKR